MRGPKHLWSGDWERDSAAISEELASLEELRRVAPGPAPGTVARPVPGEPESTLREPPSTTRARPRRERPRVRIPVPSRRARWLAAVTVALLAVLGGVAYGIDALVSSGGAPRVARTPSGPGSPMWWLGMEIESFPNGGAVIVTVPAGSLGEVAGLDPGDVILQVGTRIVNSSSDIAKAVAGLRVGHVVEIKVSRGSTLFTTRAILGAPPSSSP